MFALHALAGIVQIAVGNGHTCTLHDDGTVRCWGSNSSGELGDGTVEQHHTCALRRSGEIGTSSGDHFDKPVAVVW